MNCSATKLSEFHLDFGMDKISSNCQKQTKNHPIGMQNASKMGFPRFVLKKPFLREIILAAVNATI